MPFAAAAAVAASHSASYSWFELSYPTGNTRRSQAPAQHGGVRFLASVSMAFSEGGSGRRMVRGAGLSPAWPRRRARWQSHAVSRRGVGQPSAATRRQSRAVGA